MQRQDSDRLALLVQQTLLGQGTGYIALATSSGKCVFDAGSFSVAQDEQNTGDQGSGPHTLEKSKGGNDHQDHEDQEIVRPGELKPCLVHPAKQQVRADVKEQAAEDWFGNIGQEGGAEEQRGRAHASRDHPGCGGSGARLLVQQAAVDGKISDHAAEAAIQDVGDAIRLQLLIQINASGCGQLQSGGIEQNGEHHDRHHGEQRAPLMQQDRPIHQGYSGGIPSLPYALVGEGPKEPSFAIQAWCRMQQKSPRDIAQGDAPAQQTRGGLGNVWIGSGRRRG